MRNGDTSRTSRDDGMMHPQQQQHRQLLIPSRRRRQRCIMDGQNMIVSTKQWKRLGAIIPLLRCHHPNTLSSMLCLLLVLFSFRNDDRFDIMVLAATSSSSSVSSLREAPCYPSARHHIDTNDNNHDDTIIPKLPFPPTNHHNRFWLSRLLLLSKHNSPISQKQKRHPPRRIMISSSSFSLSEYHRRDDDSSVAVTSSQPNHQQVNSFLWPAILPELRGGAKEYDDDYDDDGLIIRSIRSIVRAVIPDDNHEAELGLIQRVLISSIRWIESICHVRLVTTTATKTSTKDKISSSLSKTKQTKTKKKKKRQLKPEQDNNTSNDDDDDDIKEKEDDDHTSTEKWDRTVPKNKTKIMKNKKTKSTVKQMNQHSNTMKHIDIKYKSTNPNYRIQKELQAFLKDPPDNLRVAVVGNNIRIWIVTMTGAAGTVYEGESFRLRIQFPPTYPTMPPSVYFLPPNIPVHEHVYTNGDICLSLLGKDWRPTMTGQSIAVSILSILSSAAFKSLPMDNARHAQNQPGQYQKDWVYHDDNC